MGPSSTKKVKQDGDSYFKQSVLILSRNFTLLYRVYANVSTSVSFDED
jgi:hypothetical protein